MFILVNNRIVDTATGAIFPPCWAEKKSVKNPNGFLAGTRVVGRWSRSLWDNQSKFPGRRVRDRVLTRTTDHPTWGGRYRIVNHDDSVVLDDGSTVSVRP